ncbi:MAG: hypothetical protein ABF241_12240, partial [Yoonia sp.]
IARIGMFGVAPTYQGMSLLIGLGFLTLGAIFIYKKSCTTVTKHSKYCRAASPTSRASKAYTA